MLKLNSKQMRMKDAFLEGYIKEARLKQDTSMFCYLCERPGDTRQPDALWSCIIPPIDPEDLSKGLKMDAIRGIWICSDCHKKIS